MPADKHLDCVSASEFWISIMTLTHFAFQRGNDREFHAKLSALWKDDKSVRERMFQYQEGAITIFELVGAQNPERYFAS